MANIRSRGVKELSFTSDGSVAASLVNLSTAQTGNAASTNVADRGLSTAASALLKVVSTVGATPTVTVAIQGSADGSNWFGIPYSLVATPSTFVVTAITITTATTNLYILQANIPVQYIRLNYTANTNVTLTADLYLYEG